MSQTPEAQAFLSRIARIPNGPGAFDALSDALRPSLEDEATLRKLFATDKTNVRLSDPHVGLVDVFSSPADIRTARARIVQDEKDLSAKFIMPISESTRRKEGALAMGHSLEEFKQNWAIFTEGSMSQLLNWDNVVAAGGSVQACLNPLPDSAKVSKRALREHYHSSAYPTSDVDLFLYGLTPEQAEAKIIAIYEAVRDSVPWDVTCIRTKHTVSIHSQYPYRSVQIVLRLYSSPAEILAGFDIDAPCCAYDGHRVWANPRAIVAIMRQCNTVDVTRRSPSYEVRLAKYSARGFEVYVPSLVREDIDPTIFERSIMRMQGLARLLVLEKLTNKDARLKYLDARRELRGRPEAGTPTRYRHTKKYKGDLKADGDFAGLESNDYDVVSLHLPYGPGWDARRIEKLVYQTDLAMNSPFNPKNKDRRFHRHPAFFGTIEECMEDCCEHCVEPKSKEDRQLQEDEDKTYVRGRIQFIQEDPGRQSMSGSFNPIDVGEWTEQAYMGPVEKLFKAIVAHDRTAVMKMVTEEGFDASHRDHVGRTPLHMAILCRATGIACDLIDIGSRMRPRLVDGRTALHLAAQLNLPDIARRLLERSALNAEKVKEAEEEAKRKEEANKMNIDEAEDGSDSEGNQDNSSEDDWDSDEGADNKPGAQNKTKDSLTVEGDQLPEDDDAPDIFDINAPDWDIAFTPLQYAIVSGSVPIVDQLIAAGANVSLVTKASGQWHVFRIDPLTATTLVVDAEVACEIVKKLVAAGAVSSQADEDQFTVFHRLIRSGRAELVSTLLRCDPSAKAVVNVPLMNNQGQTVYPIISALWQGNYSILAILLTYGAKLVFTYEDFIRAKDIRNPAQWWTNQDPLYYLAFLYMPVEVAISAFDDAISLLVALEAEVSLPILEGVRYITMNRGHMNVIEWVHGAVDAVEVLVHKSEVPEATAATITHLNTVSASPGWKGDMVKAILLSMQSSIPVSQPWELQQRKLRLRGAQEYLCTVESLLSSHNAKTWSEAYPDRAEKSVGTYSQHLFTALPEKDTVMYYRNERPRRRSPVFAHLTSQYDELFEACWTGDNAKIQYLCLPKTGSKDNDAPLQISAIWGSKSHIACTPLSLAVSSRHWDTARLVFTIAYAQYRPDQPKVEKFQTRDIVLEDHDNRDDDDDDDDEDDGDMDTDEEPLDFIDIAKRPSTVQTAASPKALLEERFFWVSADGQRYQSGTLLEKAIQEHDFEAFVQIANLYESLPQILPIPDTTCDLLLREDRSAMLDELIRRTGVGILLGDQNEIESEDTREVDTSRKTPKIYLGLNVHGVKRKDLATKGDPDAPSSLQTHNMPLLWLAAYHDAQSVLEYLASERPLSAYQYYASTHSDERAMALLRAPNLAAVLPQWLGWAMNPLKESAMTAAVVGDTVDYLMMLTELRPEMASWLTVKLDISGFNHIHVAANYGARPEVFDYLVEKGVSPVDVDHRGWNIIHLLCAQGQHSHIRLLQHVLGKLPEDIIEGLLMQQSKDHKNTPLLLCVKRRRVDLVRMLTSNPLTKASLLLRDVSGSTALHCAVLRELPVLTQILIDVIPPEGLYMEDGVGNTPLEIATQRVQLYRTRHGFPCQTEIPRSLSPTISHQISQVKFNLPRQELEVPRLRTTVNELMQEGRLTAGTKLATELVAFTDRMEARLVKDRAAAIANAELVAEPVRKEEGKDHIPQPEYETTTSPVTVLEYVEKAVATNTAPLNQPRLLVHLSDVHTSVQDTLQKAAIHGAQMAKTTRSEHRRTKSSARRIGRMEELELTPEVEKLKEQSALKYWSTNGSVAVFDPEEKLRL